MRKSWLFGLILTSGIVLMAAGRSHAQLAVSVGNPLTGGGVYVGNPYYAPGGYSYNSGYAGYAPAPVYNAAPVYSSYNSYYGAAPAYTVYRPAYGYGYRRGLAPFRRGRWW